MNWSGESPLYVDFGEVRGGQSWMDALRIDHRHLTSSLHCHLPEVLADLLDVAMAIYTADRIHRRSPGRRDDPEDLCQERQLNIRIPVRDPGRWRQASIRDPLIRALEALTFDRWEIDFARAQRLPIDSFQPKVFGETLKAPFVGLFSGGLDSLAGAVLQAVENPQRSGVLIIATTNTRLRRLQEHLIAELNRKYNQRFVPLFVPHPLDSVTNSMFPERQQEKSQRTRGFIYPVLGAVGAILAGIDELNVYENGVGALNLPYTRATIGADHSKAMHPMNLMLLSSFLSALFEQPFKIRNPSMWRTKGMMCAGLQELGLGNLATKTVSCDGYPLRDVFSQCGVCTSCLLRRVSMFAGGLIEFELGARLYKYDILMMSESQDRNRLLPLRFMLAQVERIRSVLDDAKPTRALLQVFPELYEARPYLASFEQRAISEVDANLIDLFGSYVREWDWFSLQIPAVSFPKEGEGVRWRP